MMKNWSIKNVTIYKKLHSTIVDDLFFKFIKNFCEYDKFLEVNYWSQTFRVWFQFFGSLRVGGYSL